MIKTRIEERIDELIKLYNRKINWCKGEKEGYKRSLIGELNGNSNIFIEKYARCIRLHCLRIETIWWKACYGRIG